MKGVDSDKPEREEESRKRAMLAEMLAAIPADLPNEKDAIGDFLQARGEWSIPEIFESLGDIVKRREK
jgi:hypothetical protein